MRRCRRVDTSTTIMPATIALRITRVPTAIRFAPTRKARGPLRCRRYRCLQVPQPPISWYRQLP